MPLITYADKLAGGVGAARVVNDTDMNEIKSVVNANALPRELTTTSTSTLAVNADNYDLVTVTALAAAITVSNPTGTPVNGQAILYRFKDNATARAFTSWGANFRAMNQPAMPTTTVISKNTYVTAIWNSTDSKYDSWITQQP